MAMKKSKLHGGTYGVSFPSFFKKKKGSLKTATLTGNLDDAYDVGQDEGARQKLDFDFTGSADRAASSFEATNHNSTSPPEPEKDSPESPSSPYRQWSSWSGAFQCLTASKTTRKHCPIGLLEVNIIEAFGLAASDIGMSSDPYCVATLTGYWSHGQEWPKSMRAKLQTSVKSQTLYPRWDATVTFYVPRAGAVLRLEVFDNDKMDKDDPLGFVEVPLEALLDSKTVQPWLRLKVAQPFSGKIKKLNKDKRVDPFEEPTLASSIQTRQATDSHSFATGEDEDLSSFDGGAPAKRSLFSKYLGAVSKGARFGENSCIHVSLRFHYAPLGDAVTHLLWPEDEYVYHDAAFDLDTTLTEVFKTLRLIQPLINFFNADDETGLMNLWGWQKNLEAPTLAALPRSGFWLVFLSVLYKQYPWAIWSFFQAYVVLVSWRQFHKRKANIRQFRLGRALKKRLNLGPDDPVPLNLANDVGLTRVYIAGQPQEVAWLEAEEKAKKAEKDSEKNKDGAVSTGGVALDGDTLILGGNGGGLSPFSSPMGASVGTVLALDMAKIASVVETALAVPNPEPAFCGRPPNNWTEEPYNDAVPVFYDSDDEREYFVNWIPEDHYIDCKFELDGMVGDLVDRLLAMLRAPWMDTVQNLLIKINGHLSTIHGLLDWRHPQMCKIFAGVMATSALLHLFVPFHLFFYVLNIFLFVFFTPVFKYGLVVLLLPMSFPKRLRETKRLRMMQPPLPAKVPLAEKSTYLASAEFDDEDDDDDDDDDGVEYDDDDDSSDSEPDIPSHNLHPHSLATEEDVEAARAGGGVAFEIHHLLAKLLVPDETLNMISIRKEKKMKKISKRRYGRITGGVKATTNSLRHLVPEHTFS